MRCLFCKNQSDNSKSIEHIIPESLGNHNQLLRRGIVCDQCNNYFARKVEEPFLNHPTIARLRFHQRLPNKRGRIPPITGLIFPDEEAIIRHHLDQSLLEIRVSQKAFARIEKGEEGRVYMPIGGSAPPDLIISRFLAKIALEAMAKRLEDTPDGLEYLVNESQLDAVRNHARLGTQAVWPVHTRRLYDANGWVLEENGDRSQIVHESDFLVTEQGEWYFILAIFGLELALNMAGPEVSGYKNWLGSNGNRSPLYSGKNKNLPLPKVG